MPLFLGFIMVFSWIVVLVCLLSTSSMLFIAYSRPYFADYFLFQKSYISIYIEYIFSSETSSQQNIQRHGCEANYSNPPTNPQKPIGVVVVGWADGPFEGFGTREKPCCNDLGTGEGNFRGW